LTVEINCVMWLSYQELGNTIDKSKNNEVLQQILTPATIMVVSVTASTTQGFVVANLLYLHFVQFYFKPTETKPCFILLLKIVKSHFERPNK